ncbi:hypothetical protein EP7_003518 [Isosphaeraceae bacterium EP7]
MALTTQCPQCGVVLNVPPGAIGKRLKCPRCGTRMPIIGEGQGTATSAPSGVQDVRASSSMMETASPAVFDLPMATSEGDLRETFDLTSMTGEGDLVGGSGQPARQTSDALALFAEPGPERRRTTMAEGRSKARRCTTCGGVVPIGMSICQTCGLDMDTGKRVDLEEDLVPISGPARPSGSPIGVMLLGGISLLLGLGLGIIALVQSTRNPELALGFQMLMLICAFGIFAAVQFLRGKSIKLLAIALTLGALVAVLALIVMPIYQVQMQEPLLGAKEEVVSFDETGVAPPLTEQFPINQVTWGITILLGYAAASIYLNSPPVRRHFNR